MFCITCSVTLVYFSLIVIIFQSDETIFIFKITFPCSNFNAQYYFFLCSLQINKTFFNSIKLADDRTKLMLTSVNIGKIRQFILPINGATSPDEIKKFFCKRIFKIFFYYMTLNPIHSFPNSYLYLHILNVLHFRNFICFNYIKNHRFFKEVPINDCSALSVIFRLRSFRTRIFFTYGQSCQRVQCHTRMK